MSMEYLLRNLAELAERKAINVRAEAQLWDILCRVLKREARRREEKALSKPTRPKTERLGAKRLSLWLIFMHGLIDCQTNKLCLYACKIIRLTELAPDITIAILNGRQPKALQLAEMMDDFPVRWDEQRQHFGF